MTILTRAVLAASALLLPCSAFAQHQKFSIDPAKSTVAFTLGANDGDKHGTFHLQGGSIDFDQTAPAISGSVVVVAASGDSGSGSRDKKMNKEVLDTAHFAEIGFVPTSYQGIIAATGDSTIRVTGMFTLHGTVHEMTVPAQVHIDGAACTVKTQFRVPYVAWGLKDPSWMMFKVAKDVGIDLALVGNLTN